MEFLTSVEISNFVQKNPACFKEIVIKIKDLYWMEKLSPGAKFNIFKASVHSAEFFSLSFQVINAQKEFFVCLIFFSHFLIGIQKKKGSSKVFLSELREIVDDKKCLPFV